MAEDGADELAVTPQATDESGDDKSDTNDADDGSESRSSSGDSESEDDKDPNGLSEYERAREERIKRNQERLASLGLSQGNNIPQKKKTPNPKPKKKTMDLPTRELPSRAGRATFEGLAKQKREKEEEKNLDACFTCQVEGGGEFT